MRLNLRVLFVREEGIKGKKKEVERLFLRLWYKQIHPLLSYQIRNLNWSIYLPTHLIDRYFKVRFRFNEKKALLSVSHFFLMYEKEEKKNMHSSYRQVSHAEVCLEPISIVSVSSWKCKFDAVEKAARLASRQDERESSSRQAAMLLYKVISIQFRYLDNGLRSGLLSRCDFGPHWYCLSGGNRKPKSVNL